MQCRRRGGSVSPAPPSTRRAAPVSGVALALWDLLGKLRGKPVHQLLGEPVPVNGRLKTSALDRPGFGVELNPDVPLRRRYTH